MSTQLGLAGFGEARPTVELAPGAMWLPDFAADMAECLLSDIADISSRAGFRHMRTPGGHRMSVAITNCGLWGWTSDPDGYRYSRVDPVSQRPWPAMPAAWAELAARAAMRAGHSDFRPDSCLVNRYTPGAKMGMHCDRDEEDTRAPIVSVSLGLVASFRFGGPRREDAYRRMQLRHGDVVVWGGPSRHHHHGVLPLKPGRDHRCGERRYNLTFRKARGG